MPQEGGGVSRPDVYYQVIRDIPASNWKNFARRMLKLPESVIDDIEVDHSRSIQEQKYQMLLRWEQMKGRAATIPVLLQKVKEYKAFPERDGLEQAGQTVRTPASTNVAPQQQNPPQVPTTAQQQPQPITREYLIYRSLLGTISDGMTSANTQRIKEIFGLYNCGRNFNSAAEMFYYLDDTNRWGSDQHILDKISSIKGIMETIGRQDLIDCMNDAMLDISPHMTQDQRIIRGHAHQRGRMPDLYAVRDADTTDAKLHFTKSKSSSSQKPSDKAKKRATSSQGSQPQQRQPQPRPSSGSVSGTGVHVHVENLYVQGSNSSGLNLGSMASAAVAGQAANAKALANITQAEKKFDDLSKVEGEVEVQCSDESFYYEHLANEDRIYQIRNNPKGHVLIVSNTDFAWGETHKRKGGEKDVKLMKTLWEKIGCKVFIRENKTKDQMENILKDFAKQGFHLRSDFCVVIIMSHGGQAENGVSIVYGSDNKSIPAEDIVRLFDNDKCKALQRRPKLFFFQFCRGTTFDLGADIEVPMDDCKDSLSNLLPQDSSDASRDQKLPTRSDMLVAYSTFAGNLAFRDEKYGSWFINAITNVFMRGAHNTHVADLMTEVKSALLPRSARTGDITTDGAKMMADCHDCLLKKLYLFPGFPLQDTSDSFMTEEA